MELGGGGFSRGYYEHAKGWGWKGGGRIKNTGNFWKYFTINMMKCSYNNNMLLFVYIEFL